MDKYRNRFQNEEDVGFDKDLLLQKILQESKDKEESEDSLIDRSPSSEEKNAMTSEDRKKALSTLYKTLGWGKYTEPTPAPTPMPSPYGPEMSPEMKIKKLLQSLGPSDSNGEEDKYPISKNYPNLSPSSLSLSASESPSPSPSTTPSIPTGIGAEGTGMKFNQKRMELNRSPQSINDLMNSNYSPEINIDAIKQIQLLTPEEREELQNYLKTIATPTATPSSSKNIRNLINKK